MRNSRLLILLFLLPALFCIEEERKRQTLDEDLSEPTNIVFLGDSLTAGAGLNGEESFPARIESKLRERGKNYGVVNAGKVGDTTADGLARVDEYLNTRVAPYAMVICLGANDGMRNIQVATMKNNLKQIIGKVRAYDKNIKIFLVAMEPLTQVEDAYGKQFKDAYPQLAAEEKVTLVPYLLQGVAGRKAYNQIDGIHPNARGMRKATENVWRGLEPHL